MSFTVRPSGVGDQRQALRRLARDAGVYTSYDDAMGQRRVASTEALIAVLRALGLPIEHVDDAESAHRTLHEHRRQRVLRSNCVAWNGRRIRAVLNVDRRISPDAITATVQPAQGGRSIDLHVRHVNSIATDDSELRQLIMRWSPSVPIPLGTHPMTVRVADRDVQSHVISAPYRCFEPAASSPSFGAFLPLYALHSSRSLAVGDLQDLAELSNTMIDGGAEYIGTLPLLACFLDDPFDPSPYSPVSRLFWNELYADLQEDALLQSAPQARDVLNEPESQQILDEARRARLVEYQPAAQLKHRIIDALADRAFSNEQSRAGLEQFMNGNSEAGRYASYRAAVHEFGSTWQSWSRDQDDRAQRGDWSGDPRWRRHLYSQWLMSEQLDRLNAALHARGAGLYLDLPVGANDGGYDRWRFRDQFAKEMNVGAPPDPFFTGGQNWGFSPLHPWHSAARQHEYFADTLDAHCRVASMLRIDHVMALHRLFWIPHGMDATDGVYVRYPRHELYAVLALASQQHECRIVGENLGTVPPSVTRTMKRHGALGMRVAQFEFSENVESAVPRPGAHSLASLNTHDMPPFASFWHGDDIDQRLTLNLLTPQGADEERDKRRRIRSAVIHYLQMTGFTLDESASTDDVMRAVTLALADSDASVLMLNLEDAWLEPEPQNVPGTTEAHYPSWKRRAAKSLEEICTDAGVHALLRAVRQHRARPRQHDESLTRELRSRRS